MRSQGRFGCQMVVRMPYGGGVRALEHHSEREEQFYAHVPGLKMVIPSGPRNARALLAAAIRDPDPVIFFEAKALYHAAKEDVPDEIETMEIGRARVDRPGTDLTLIAYGAMVRVAREAAEQLHAESGAEVEIVDLLTISPLDRETLAASVRKTGGRSSCTRPRGLRGGGRDRGQHHGGRVPSLEAPVGRDHERRAFVSFARERQRLMSRMCACRRRSPLDLDMPRQFTLPDLGRPHRGGDRRGAGARGRRHREDALLGSRPTRRRSRSVTDRGRVERSTSHPGRP
jgi:hypothetical protein